jgi:hypothetical protein
MIEGLSVDGNDKYSMVKNILDYSRWKKDDYYHNKGFNKVII